MKKDTAGNHKGPEPALVILDALLQDPGQKKISENQIMVILDALASSDDAEVVVRFPAVLAICARRGLALNSHALFSRYWETSPKRQNLEKLLLVSATLFGRAGIAAPKNLEKIAVSLMPKYGDLLSRGELQLSSGMCISLKALQTTLKIFTDDSVEAPLPRRTSSVRRSDNLDTHLDRLFSPKQKELVLKKRDGKAFTKTEREYYSRVVRKKLTAIAAADVGALARKLIGQ